MALVYNWITGQFEEEKSDFRFYEFGGANKSALSSEDTQKVNLAKQSATNAGNISLVAVLDGILKYGGGFLDVLTRNGIIANKNIALLTNGQYNQANLNELIAKNGGVLGDPDSIKDRSANTLFGLNQSTLILILAAVLLYTLFKK